MNKIYFAGGCFWGVEHFFKQLNGVIETSVGYANCDVENPSYEIVKAHKTTAAETVEVIYDEKIISLQELCNLFFLIIDPTVKDRQKEDIGHQYRTGIYYLKNEELVIINSVFNSVSKNYKEKIVTEIQKLENFYKAEEYHQDYLDKNPNGYCHLNPKMFELARKYKNRSEVY